MHLVDRLKAAADSVRLRADTSPERHMSAALPDDRCGFTQEEIDAAPDVEVVDVDEDD